MPATRSEPPSAAQQAKVSKVTGMAKLLAKAQAMAANSTADGAAAIDVNQWLARWLERPQPALGGLRPAEVLDTSEGLSQVERLLGSIESGAFQ